MNNEQKYTEIYNPDYYIDILGDKNPLARFCSFYNALFPHPNEPENAKGI